LRFGFSVVIGKFDKSRINIWNNVHHLPVDRQVLLLPKPLNHLL
jgi:hypothetical protein